jgi:hypothetical protein
MKPWWWRRADAQASAPASLALASLCLLVWVGLASAQGVGVFQAAPGTARPTCFSISNPVPAQTWCLDGNVPYAVKLWDGLTYASVAGGAGGVSSIATTAPIEGGPITATGAISCPTCSTRPVPNADLANPSATINGVTCTLGGECFVGQGSVTGTFLVSGGGVSWVSGLTFTVSAATYYIDGTLYNSPQATVTLPAADPSLARIDTIIVTSGSIATSVQGQAAAPPFEPSLDPTSQLKLSSVLVAAGATTPSDLTRTLIYDENTGGPGEWVATASAGTLITNSTAFPNTGSLDIEGTAVALGDQVTFVKASGTVNMTTQDTLVFFVRVKTAWSNNKRIRLLWRSGGTQRGQFFDVRNGQLGFSSSTTGVYQQIVVPIAQFGIPAGAAIDTLVMRIVGGGAPAGFYWDTISLQAGVGQPPGPVVLPGGGVNALQYNRNGTVFGGIEATTDDAVVVSDGTSWNITALPNCLDVGGAHLNYVAATNSFVCGTSGGGTGTVTSVAMTVPSFLSVTGSPVTTSGTLALALTTQTANTHLAGPSSGPGVGVPTFRTLVLGDLPAGVGTVTSIATSAPLTGGTITGTGTIGITVPTCADTGGQHLNFSGSAFSCGTTSTGSPPGGSSGNLQTNNGSGGFGAFAGTSCTNQFIRSQNASGVATCATVSLTSDITGNLPVANLNSGTGATSSTYWSGNGTWQTPPLGTSDYGGTTSSGNVAITALSSTGVGTFTPTLYSAGNGTPTVNTCGTGSPSVVGTDARGTITTGSGATTACTLAFSTTLASTPFCVAVGGPTSPAAALTITATSQTAVTFAFTSAASKNITYICVF